ncbi:hypothetical protein [Marinomonas shanghaiensis]|uniref:hypothetical protein n=1 Tax=Marinomonas shanghaiensis TaxID=2202418 RepID=UPI003A94AFAE
MTPEEKDQYVKDFYLDEAIASINKHGRYWNSGIARGLAYRLHILLENLGYSDIQMREIAPIWEHVYFMPNDSKLVEKIALERAEIMEDNFDYLEENMPK